MRNYAYPLADQNTLDNLVIERFREGHGNEELQKHLCLYPSNVVPVVQSSLLRQRR